MIKIYKKKYIYFTICENNDIDNPSMEKNFIYLTKENLTLTKELNFKN